MEKWKLIKKTGLQILSYLLVAVAASVITFAAFDLKPGKLEMLEGYIQERFIGEADLVAAEDAAAAAMVNALGDQWSYYVSASDYAAYNDGKTNSFVGIGITIIMREDGAGLDILKVEPDSPAEKAGLLAGDILIGADGQSLVGKTTADASNLITGTAGTKVEVEVLRGEEKLTFLVKRAKLETVVAEGTLLADGTGYVRIENFNDRCSQETIDAIEALLEQGATALVFDVRNNPGGYVHEMVQILDYLLPEGDLFRSVSYTGEESVDKSDADCLELPMAVLVNEQSYSAAEFFAAALREYDWATVVGNPTVGKSYYQNTLDLGDGSVVALSVGKYYTPKGVCLADEGGLIPDQVVEVDDETALQIYAQTLAAEDDPQLQAAIEALK